MNQKFTGSTLGSFWDTENYNWQLTQYKAKQNNLTYQQYFLP